MAKILIVDDHETIRTTLVRYFESNGYQTFQASDGIQALDLFKQCHPDIILLDVMMPKLDGYEVCRAIRQVSQVPIIMVTAKHEDYEKIMGLDIGADDYIVKPFSSGELLARVRAILRRLPSSHSIKIGNVSINIDEYVVLVNDQKINLSKKEIELLYHFACHPNLVFTRDQLLDTLWGIDYYGDSRTVDTHIKRLRSKLSLNQISGFELKTIWGVGYKIETASI